jgi:hypothetical protein
MAWEYKVDSSSGSVHELERALNDYAVDGWRAVMFKHASSAGPMANGGSTIIVVFEREVAAP